MLFYIAQAVSVLTIIFTCLGIFQKDKAKIMLYFTFANLSILTTYFLLGRYLGALLVVGATIRTLVYYAYAKFNKKPQSIVLVFFEAYFVIISIVLWSHITDLFVLVNLCMLTYTTWQNDIKLLRFSYVLSSVLLISYDIIIGAYVAIVSDIIALIVDSFAIYKFYKNNKSLDIVKYFYNSVSSTYQIEITDVNEQSYSYILSNAINDIYNNFVYIPKLSNINLENVLPQVKAFMKSKSKPCCIYIKAETVYDIPPITELKKSHKELFHDSWMKLRQYSSVLKPKCIENGMEYKSVDASCKQEILSVFREGFVDFPNDIYYYSNEYIDKYDIILTNEDLSKYNITPYLAYFNGKPVSMLFIYQNGTNAFICQVATKVDYRRKGIASSLINYAIKDQRKLGIEDFYLVTKKYTYLEMFYMQNNFEEIAQGFCLNFEDTEIQTSATENAKNSKPEADIKTKQTRKASKSKKISN